jgi:anti-sigma regulatory factor (Ser/Thr protein kinase)
MSIPAWETPPGESSGKLPDTGKPQAEGGLYGWCLLPAIPSSVAFARAYTRMIIARHELEVDADAAESVISELVANALQHAYHDKASMDQVVHVEVASFGGGVVVSAFDLLR